MSSHCHLTLQFDLTLQDTHLHSQKRLFIALLLETDLNLNFEKSSWKNQVRLTGFLDCKNQFRN
jgi:hypothetical protein